MDVLGPLRVRIDGVASERASLAGQKPRQLLGVLALARGAPVTKERLADLLWSERQPLNVAATLATYVSVLRHRVGLDSALEGRGAAYRLDTSKVRLDLDDFDRAVAAAAGQPPRRARAHLEHALELVRDELLADEPYADWVEPDRSRYRRRHVEVLVAAAEATLACRDLEAATGLAERALGVDPFDEPAGRCFLLGLHALGRRGAALLWYEGFVERLRNELLVEPAAGLRDLAEAIRRDQPSAALLPPVAPDLPAHVWDSGPTGIPFLGRAPQLAALTDQAARLREGRSGLVVVDGETGMGKSRLVREFAARVDLPVGLTRCSQAERRLPYAALLRALRDALAHAADDAISDIVEDLLGEAEVPHERRVLPALGRLVDEHGPVAVVLDDAHWADRSSLMALLYLASVHPALAVATARPRIMALQHPLHLFDSVLHLGLRPLTPLELTGVGGADAHATTGGVPLLVAEWLQARREGRLEALPGQLAPWVDEQVRRAGVPARDLLAAAAALDGDFALHDVAPVVGPVSVPVIDAVEHLCDAGLLQARAARYAISCRLVREICASVLFPVRVSLVGQVLGGARGVDAAPTAPDVDRPA